MALKQWKEFFFKYGQLERILMHLQNKPIYYAKYKKEKSEVKALIELIKERVVEVKATEEKNVKMMKTVTLETQEQPEEEKKQDEWIEE